MEFNTLEDASKMFTEMNGGDVPEAETAPMPVVGEDVNDQPKVEETIAPDQVIETQPEIVETHVVADTEPKEVETPANTEGMVYQPNFEYNVKGEKKEFDERLKSVVKSPEDEDFVRDLITKAEGIDGFKEKLSDLQEKNTAQEEVLSSMSEKNEAISQFYTGLVEQRDKGNIREVCKGLGLSEDAILRHAIEIANERALPQEEQARIKSTRELAEQNTMLQQQQVQAQSQYQNQYQSEALKLHEQRVQMEQKQLDFILDNKYSDLSGKLKANDIDLEREVIINGTFLNNTRPQGAPELTIAEAVEATVKKFGMYNQAPVQQAPVKQQVRRDAIPTIGGGSVAPVAQSFSSLDALQKQYDNIKKESGTLY